MLKIGASEWTRTAPDSEVAGEVVEVSFAMTELAIDLKPTELYV